MPRLLQSIVVATLLLLSGCSFVDGVSVKIRPASADAFKKQFEIYRQAQGFGPVQPLAKEGFMLRLTPSSGQGSQHSLYASFFRDGDKFVFFVGKAYSHSFSEAEQKVVLAFIDFLAEHPEMIQSNADAASSLGKMRAAFEARFRKN